MSSLPRLSLKGTFHAYAQPSTSRPGRPGISGRDERFGRRKSSGVGRVTLSRVLNGNAAISPEMAVRLAAAFGTSSPEVWLAM
ncbi:MAG: helix-turn-helix transcriptional regulator [Acidobacteriaceae bacterium]